MPSGKHDPDKTVTLGKAKGEGSVPGEMPEDIDVLLVVIEGFNGGQEYPVLKSKVVIGREGGSADVIVPDTGISRLHAEVSLDKTTWYLRDLGSTNGTHKNGAKIVRTALRHGDKFKIGETVMQFLCEEKTQRSGGKVYEIESAD